MDTLIQDVKYALRSLRRTPGFTLIVIAVMALGIGVNSLIYTVVRGILFADLPFPQPERVVAIEVTNHKRPNDRTNMSMPDLRDVMDRAKTLRGTFGLTGWSPIVSTGRPNSATDSRDVVRVASLTVHRESRSLTTGSDQTGPGGW